MNDPEKLSKLGQLYQFMDDSSMDRAVKTATEAFLSRSGKTYQSMDESSMDRAIRTAKSARKERNSALLQGLAVFVDRYKRNPCGDSEGGFEAGNTCQGGGSATQEGPKALPKPTHGPHTVIPATKFREATPQQFVEGRDKSSRAGFLAGKSVEDLEKGVKEGGRIYLSEDGLTGYYIDPKGDLQNVFNNSKTKGAGVAALVNAVANGAETLDCYDGFLPILYNRLGFKAFEAYAWDDQYKPADWDTDKQGRPDVVMMRYEGGTRDRAEIEQRFHSGHYGGYVNPRAVPHERPGVHGQGAGGDPPDRHRELWAEVDGRAPRVARRPGPSVRRVLKGFSLFVDRYAANPCGDTVGGFQKGNTCQRGGAHPVTGKSPVGPPGVPKPDTRAKGVYARAAAKAKAAVAKGDRVITTSIAKAREHKKIVTVNETQYAEKQEEVLAAKTGFTHVPGDYPTDMEWHHNGVAHGFEVKTICVAGPRSKIDARPLAMWRKIKWCREHGKKAAFHTIALDHRNKYKGDGQSHKEDYSGHEIYYKRGNGEFRLSAMHQCKDYAELRRLAAMSEDDPNFPPKARSAKGRFTDALKSKAAWNALWKMGEKSTEGRKLRAEYEAAQKMKDVK